MLLSGKRIGYLGCLHDIHYANLCSIFAGEGLALPILDISLDPNDCEHQLFFNRDGERVVRDDTGWRRIRSHLGGLDDPQYGSTVAEFLRATGCEVIFACWGTNVVPHMLSLKRIRPELTVIWDVLCHPMGLDQIRVWAQNILLSRSIGACCDGIIFPSSAMKEYFETKVVRSQLQVPHVVLPPLWSRRYFTETSAAAREEIPNVVFLGRTDWERGQLCDDVGRHLWDIMETGVVVHHAVRKRKELPYHKNRRTFGYQRLEELAGFASGFDVSLIYYNLDGVRTTDRFENTVPDRLMASISAGIPVAIPKAGYRASKEHLERYQAYLTYQDANDLKRQLLDRQRMAELKQVAKRNRKLFIAEDHLDQLEALLQQVCYRRAGALASGLARAN